MIWLSPLRCTKETVLRTDKKKRLDSVKKKGKTRNENGYGLLFKNNFNIHGSSETPIILQKLK